VAVSGGGGCLRLRSNERTGERHHRDYRDDGVRSSKPRAGEAHVGRIGIGL